MTVFGKKGGSGMDEKQVDLVVDNILDICKVKVKTPTMLDDLRKYVIGLDKDISEGRL